MSTRGWRSAGALHAAEGVGAEHVPDVENRIPAGEWTDCRKKNFEDAGEASEWANYVQVTEITYTRVHRAAYTVALYNHKTRDRGA